MIFLTERQRQDAIAMCDRILELNAKLQADGAKLLEAIDRYAARKSDDVKSTGSAS